MRPMRSAPSGASSSMSEMARAMARGSRASNRSDSGAATLLPQELSRDDQALDFAGALADGAQLDVTEEFLGRVVFDESVPAVNLHRLFGGPDGNLARVQLGHGRLAPGAHDALVLEPGGPIGEQPCGLNAGGHVGQLPLDGLKTRDGLAKLPALFRIPQRRLVRALGQPDRQGRNADAAVIENLQRVDEPLPLLADHRLCWHVTVL